MNYCTEGHRIDDTNESTGGIICGVCGETFSRERDFDIDWPVDEYDLVLDALIELELGTE